jgi:transcriptional regulator with XRE-family HTH domain
MAANLRLKIARMAAEMTQQQLAAACGIQEQHITRLETGRLIAPPPEVRARIAEILGVRPFEIFDR